MIHPFVSFHLNYCNSLYFGISYCFLSRLQLVQNAAAGGNISLIISHQTWFHGIGSLWNIGLILLLFVFKSLNNLAPHYLPELLHPHRLSRLLRSNELDLFSVPWSRLKSRGDCAFAHNSTKINKSNKNNIYIISQQIGGYNFNMFMSYSIFSTFTLSYT